jgi:magnesium-transporting ATPase (P-type)
MIQRFCDWLAGTSLSNLFSTTEWFVPTIQTIHILAIAVVVTLLAMLNVRLLRMTGDQPSLPALAGAYIPLVWISLCVLLVTGILLTITEPARELMNDVFRVKMLLVAVLVVLTIIVRSTLRRDPDYWTASVWRRRLGRGLALAMMTLCVGIVVAGRFIAYTGSG